LKKVELFVLDLDCKEKKVVKNEQAYRDRSVIG